MAKARKGGVVSTSRKDVVETYIEGFRRSDHAMVLACLADDVVWDVYGQTTITGKDAFDAAIENDALIGSPGLLNGSNRACSGCQSGTLVTRARVRRSMGGPTVSP
jgi:ketosteroid isomerase-like protein